MKPEPAPVDLPRAGDILAEMLGHVLAWSISGEPLTDKQVAGARRGILLWHRMRAERENRTW